ncbi:hypothetical protein Adt_37797 [Abeliophyllum distichum]|uniref:Ribosomal protein S3 n=1 Tax=Abeliophyllum distichum TaxID=126358 RepID=A0ABD1Q4G5_9LAMI
MNNKSWNKKLNFTYSLRSGSSSAEGTIIGGQLITTHSPSNGESPERDFVKGVFSDFQISRREGLRGRKGRLREPARGERNQKSGEGFQLQRGRVRRRSLAKGGLREPAAGDRISLAGKAWRFRAEITLKNWGLLFMRGGCPNRGGVISYPNANVDKIG